MRLQLFPTPLCALPSTCTSPRHKANAGGSCYCTIPHMLRGFSMQDRWVSSYFYFLIAFSSINLLAEFFCVLKPIFIYQKTSFALQEGTQTHYNRFYICSERDARLCRQTVNDCIPYQMELHSSPSLVDRLFAE